MLVDIKAVILFKFRPFEGHDNDNIPGQTHYVSMYVF